MTELIKDKLYAIVVPEDAILEVRKKTISVIRNKVTQIVNPNFQFEYIGFLTKSESSFNQVQFTQGKYSLRSLIESKGLYFVSPYGSKEPDHIYSDSPNKYESKMYQEKLNQWQQAENSLIQKLLIIEKI